MFKFIQNTNTTIVILITMGFAFMLSVLSLVAIMSEYQELLNKEEEKIYSVILSGADNEVSGVVGPLEMDFEDCKTLQIQYRKKQEMFLHENTLPKNMEILTFSCLKTTKRPELGDKF